MVTYWYVVEIELVSTGDDNSGTMETTGWKNVVVYDIDTQSMDLVVVGELNIPLEANSEETIRNDSDIPNLKLIKL